MNLRRIYAAGLLSLFILPVMTVEGQTLVDGVGTEDFNSYATGVFPSPTETEWYEFTGTASINDEFCPDALTLMTNCLRVSGSNTARFRLLEPSSVTSWSFFLRWCGEQPQDNNHFSIGDSSSLIVRLSMECDLGTGGPTNPIFIYAYDGPCSDPQSSEALVHTFLASVPRRTITIDMDWNTKQYAVSVGGTQHYTAEFLCPEATLTGGIELKRGTGAGTFFSIDDIVMTDVGNVLVQPAEFDEGLKDYFTAVGFRTFESQLFLAVVFTGISTVVTGASLKLLNSGRIKHYIIMGTQASIGVFCVVLLFMELWMYMLALVLGFFISKGPAEVRNTWQELRRLNPESPSTANIENGEHPELEPIPEPEAALEPEESDEVPVGDEA